MKQFQVPYAHPSIGAEEIFAVKRVLESGWITSGKETIKFENEFAQYVNSHPNSHTNPVPLRALSVQSCSAGLHLATEALNLPGNKQVLLSPYTFTATASSILHAGLEIEFIDIDKQCLFPGPDDFKKKIKTGKYSAVVFPHITGTVDEQYNELLNLARRYKLKIIEDAAHSFPALKEDGYLGTYGDIGVYSFYANKTITTGEGGMIVSRNPELMKKIEMLRDHGCDKNTWNRYNNKPQQSFYDIVELGYKYNMSDIQSAIGRIQLKKARALHKKRIKLAMKYIELLRERDYWIVPQKPTNPFSHSWHIFMLQLQHKNLSRTELIHKLAKKGIGVSVHYRPLHVMSYYRKRYSLSPEDFPNSLARYESTLSLPMFPDLDMEKLTWVCNTLINTIDKH